MPRKTRHVDTDLVQREAVSLLNSFRHRDIDPRAARESARRLDKSIGAQWMTELAPEVALAVDTALMDIAARVGEIVSLALSEGAFQTPPSIAASRERAEARKAEEAARVQESKEAADERRRQQFEEAQGRREAQRRQRMERSGQIMPVGR